MTKSDKDFIEIRCPKCGKLIFRFEKGASGMVEFYCTRCHTMHQLKLQ